jgi:2'-5' RNA ligase
VRLFVAIEIPAEVCKRLAELIGDFRVLAPSLKWVRAENLHLTLKFIGEVESTKLDAIRSALAGIRPPGEFELTYQGLGFFPSEKRPRILWSGIQATPELAQLAFEIDMALSALGVPREERAFAPHLTLARLGDLPLPGSLRTALSRRVTEEFGVARVTEFHLIESKLKSTGAEYTTVQSFALATEH